MTKTAATVPPTNAPVLMIGVDRAAPVAISKEEKNWCY